MLCEKCDTEFTSIDCPCSWTSYYGASPAGYELASAGDIPEAMNHDIRQSLYDGMSVIMYGPSGSGKSHAAIATAKAISNEREVEFKVFSKYEDIKNFVSVPILVINELSNEHYDLCEERHTNGLITIASTNLITNVSGSLSSKIDERYTQWRFNCICLADPLSRDWIIKRRHEKQSQYEAWKAIQEERCHDVDIGALLNDEDEDMEEAA